MSKVGPMLLAQRLKQSDKVVISCPNLNFSHIVNKQDKNLMIEYLEQDVKSDAEYNTHFSKKWKEIVIEVR